MSTDVDANAGPILSMRRESGSPADNDLIGQLDFIGKDSGGANTQYASIKGIIKDVTNDTEDGALEFVTFKSGFLNNALTLGNTETVFNDASVDVDFRVESNGQANAFKIDGGNDTASFAVPVDMASTLAVTGIATFTDDIIIGDGKTIGSASDPDAITIASNGQLTLTQTLIGTALDISGDIDVDGTTNLDAVDIDGNLDERWYNKIRW